MSDIQVPSVWEDACELLRSFQKKGLSPAQTVLLLGTAIIAVNSMLKGYQTSRHSSVEQLIIGALEAIEADRQRKPS